MKILRSGPFPRKSSGACRFLVGLLGLSSADLFQWEKVKTPSYTQSTSQRKPSFCHPDVPLFDKTGAAVIFPAIPVLLGVEDVLFGDQMVHFTASEKRELLKSLKIDKVTKANPPQPWWQTCLHRGGFLVEAGNRDLGK